MPQFIIQAKDFTDEDALNRRLKARQLHLERMKEEKRKQVFVVGGALLSDESKMIGSVIILSLPDKQSVHQWIAEDPYIKNKVWDEITITPFAVADV